jgi:hypothetical protein
MSNFLKTTDKLCSRCQWRPLLPMCYTVITRQIIVQHMYDCKERYTSRQLQSEEIQDLNHYIQPIKIQNLVSDMI